MRLGTELRIELPMGLMDEADEGVVMLAEDALGLGQTTYGHAGFLKVRISTRGYTAPLSKSTKIIQNLFLAPPLRSRRACDLVPPLGRHALRTGLAAVRAQFLRGLVLAVVSRLGLLLDLAGGDLHHHHGSADHVGGALLASWSLRHLG